VSSLVFGFSIVPALFWSFVASGQVVTLLAHPEVIENTKRLLPAIAIFVVAVLAVLLAAVSAIAVFRRKPMQWPVVALYATAFVHVLNMFVNIETLRDH
jgi:amino acid transporter